MLVVGQSRAKMEVQGWSCEGNEDFWASEIKGPLNYAEFWPFSPKSKAPYS